MFNFSVKTANDIRFQFTEHITYSSLLFSINVWLEGFVAVFILLLLLYFSIIIQASYQDKVKIFTGSNTVSTSDNLNVATF